MPFDPMTFEGKCRGCGLLAKRPFYPHPLPLPYIEVAVRERESQRLETGTFYRGEKREPYETHPSCVVGAADLYLEWVDRAKLLPPVLDADRGCPAWFKYLPGLSPEKHLELRNMELLEKSRRDWELKLEEQNKAFLAGLDEQRRKWERREGRWPNRLIWAAIILAIGEVAGTFLSLPAITRWLGLD